MCIGILFLLWPSTQSGTVDCKQVKVHHIFFLRSAHISFIWYQKRIVNLYTIIQKIHFLPFGMPHGGLVRILSKKSKSNFRAGGKVNPTWADVSAKLINNVQRVSHCVADMFKVLILLILTWNPDDVSLLVLTKTKINVSKFPL